MAKKKKGYKRNDPPLFYIATSCSIFTTMQNFVSKVGSSCDLDLFTKLKFMSIEAGLNMSIIITKS